MSSAIGLEDGFGSEDEHRGYGDFAEEEEYDRFDIFMPAVQSLVNAIGGYEEVETSPGKLETIYRPGDSVLAVLKDLKKLWRKDDTDDERTVARCMAKAGLMKELLSLLVECTDRGEWGRKVSLVTCDLIAALTWPIDVQQELKEMEDEPDVITDYATLLRSQLEYKALMIQGGKPLRCILTLMLPCLAKPKKDERDEKVISLGLHIVRNLLGIRDTVADGHSLGEKEELAHLQSSLILQLHKLTFFQLILTLASYADKAEFNQYNVIVLDILHLTFRAIKPRDLAQDQDKAPMEKLKSLLANEKKVKVTNSRTGMTRHSRFGTTVAVKAGDTKLILHKQNAIKANAETLLDDIKRKRASRAKRLDELTQAASLSPDALRALQDLAKKFLQSCFNTFFASILKDIRMERIKIRDTDNIRTLFLSRFFMEYLLVERAKQSEKKEKKEESEKGKEPAGEPLSDDLSYTLVAEMAEMDSVKWVVGRMRITMDDKPPAWTELQACLDCFSQILLLIEAMSTSPIEEDQEVAEGLQNQLYYNGDILESSLQVVATYKDQSVAYLDSVIHFAYVLLKMLEKYSKNKQFMFVRKRKAAKARKLKRDQAAAEAEKAGTQLPEEYEGEDEEAIPEKDVPSYGEHVFTFKSFERRFAQEGVVNTLLTYLARFKEFDDTEQMKRVVGLMHRQIIKTQAEGLYFKVSCLHLFRQMLDAQSSLPKHESSRDLITLVTFVLRKFFKKVKEDPFLIIEALTAKSRNRWKDLSSYQSDEDDEMGGQKGRIREKMANGPAELEFVKKKNLSWSQQMEVVVAMLFKDGHEEWIKWIIEVLELACALRTEIVLAVDGVERIPDPQDSDDEDRPRNFGGPSKDAIEKFVQHDLEPGTDDQKQAITKDSHFRLMLKLLAFEHTEDDEVELQKWFIPASVVPSSLSTSLGALKQYLEHPPSLTDDPKTLLRKTRKRRLRADTPSEDEFGNPKPKPIRRKKAAETQHFKSAAFIVDSDDDEAADAAFFAREAQLRLEMQEMAEKQGHAMRKTGTKKRKSKKGKEKAVNDGDSDEGDDVGNTQRTEVSGGSDLEMDVEDSQMPLGDEGDDESEDHDSPIRKKRGSSALLDSDAESDNSRTPQTTSGTRVNGKIRRIIDSDEEDD